MQPDEITIGMKVAFQGMCCVVRKRLEDGNYLITSARRSYGFNRAQVAPDKLAAWQPKPKVSQHAKTCQICSRQIHAATGMIAHHGYERPMHGWQTASCYGARHLPWEVSRDALGDYLRMVANDCRNQRSWLTLLLRGRETLRRQEIKKDALGRTLYDRDGKRETHWVDYEPGHPGYATVLAQSIAETRSNFKQAVGEYRYQWERYQGWKPAE